MWTDRLQKSILLLFLIFGFAGASPLAAAADSQPASPGKERVQAVTAKLIADTSAVTAGKSFRLGVEFEMAPGWHIYYRDPGETGKATELTWILPDGFRAGDLQWQKPETEIDSGFKINVYKDRTLIVAVITPPSNLQPGDQVSFGAKVSWLACKDSCVPGKSELSLSMPVASAASPAQAANADKFAAAGTTGGNGSGAQPVSVLKRTWKVVGADDHRGHLAFYLLLAFVGGLILNVMPCVLPVVAIKILGFVRQSGEDKRRIFRLGLAYTAGTIGTFMVLALVVVAVQWMGMAAGWGFQFQQPAFLIAMSAIVLLMALGLFDLFSVDLSVGQQEIDQLAAKEGMPGAFFKGVLATMLSTPCSAPFLGTAVGFAFTQSWWVVLAIFFTVGLGMSSPYLLLTANPGWMRFLPKPGVWMLRFKEAMGFVLIATSLWLLSVLSGQVGAQGVMLTACFLLSLSFAAWMISRFADTEQSVGRKVTVWALAGVLTASSLWFFVKPALALRPDRSPSPAALPSGTKSGVVWEPFSVKALDEHLARGETVFIDCTADWCLTCKANEQAVINTQAITAKLRANKVVAMRADWTSQDPEISELLQKLGRKGVPCYVVFPGSRPDEPILLPEVITQRSLLEALDKGGASTTTP
jgi:thiol:disulfide interchange protein DsbD